MSALPQSRRLADWIERYRGVETGDVLLDRHRIYILPTRTGVTFWLVVCVLLIGSINFALQLGYLLTFTIVSMALVSMYHTHRNLSGLTIRGQRADPVHAGDMASFELTIDNPFPTERYALNFSFMLPARPARLPADPIVDPLSVRVVGGLVVPASRLVDRRVSVAGDRCTAAAVRCDRQRRIERGRRRRRRGLRRAPLSARRPAEDDRLAPGRTQRRAVGQVLRVGRRRRGAARIRFAAAGPDGRAAHLAPGWLGPDGRRRRSVLCTEAARSRDRHGTRPPALRALPGSARLIRDLSEP